MQQSRFLALVSSYDRLKQLTQTAADSEGAATEQFEKSLEGIEAKTQQLQTNLQNLYTSAGLEEAYSEILSIGSNILDFYNNIADNFGNGIQGLLAAIVTIGTQFYNVANVVTNVLKIIKSRYTAQQMELNAVSQVYTKIRTGETLSAEEQTIAAQYRLREQLEERTTALVRQHANLRRNITTTSEAANGSNSVARGTAGQIGSIISLASSLIGPMVGEKEGNIIAAAGGGAAAILQAFAGDWRGAIMSAISAIGPTISLIKEASKTVDKFTESIEKNQQATEKAAESNKKLQNMRKELDDLETINEKLEEYKKHRYDSAEAEKQYFDYMQQVADLYPDLIDYYDAEKNAIVGTTDALTNKIKVQKDLLKEQERSAYFDRIKVDQSLKDTRAFVNTGMSENDVAALNNIIEEAKTEKGGEVWPYLQKMFKQFSELNKRFLSDVEIGTFFGIDFDDDLIQDPLIDKIRKLVYDDSTNRRYIADWTRRSSGSAATAEVLMQILYERLKRAEQEGLSLNAALAQFNAEFFTGLDASNSYIAYFLENVQRYASSEAIDQRLRQLQEGIDLYINQLEDPELAGFSTLEKQALGAQLRKQFLKEYDEDTILSMTQETYASFVENFFANADITLLDDAKSLHKNYYGANATQKQIIEINNALNDLGNYTEQQIDELISGIEETKGGQDFKAAWQHTMSVAKDNFNKALLNFQNSIKGTIFETIDSLNHLTPRALGVMSRDIANIDLNKQWEEEQRQAVIGIYSEIWKIIDKSGVNYKTLENLFADNDITTLFGITTILDNLPYFEGAKDLEDHLKALSDNLEINFTLEFSTYIQNLNAQLENFSKTLENAKKGLSFEEAVKVADKLKISISDFRQVGNKFFLDDYESILEAYLSQQELWNILSEKFDEATASPDEKEQYRRAVLARDQFFYAMSESYLAVGNLDAFLEQVTKEVNDTTSIEALRESILNGNWSELPDYLQPYITQLVAYVNSLNKNVVDAFSSALQGNGTQIVTVTDIANSNTNLLDYLAPRGLVTELDKDNRIIDFSNATVNQLSDIYDLIIEGTIIGLTNAQKETVLKQLNEQILKKNKGNIFKEIIENYKEIDEELALQYAEAVGENLSDLVKKGRISFNKLTRKYSITFNKLQRQIEEMELNPNVDKGQLAEVKDTLHNILSEVSNLLVKSLEGTLNEVEKNSLTNSVKDIWGIDLTKMFSGQEQAAKLSTDNVLKLYYSVAQLDRVASKPLFEALTKTLSASGEACENISETMSSIAKIEKEIENNSNGTNKELEERLKLYKQIAYVQMDDASNYKFMDRSLSNPMQAPLDYYNSAYTMMNVMNEAAENGYISFDNFKNIVDEMNRWAAMGAEDISFLGYELNGSFTSASDLIKEGIGHFVEIDGQTVVSLEGWGIDFEQGAENMATGIDKGIQKFAANQIKIIDSLISYLKVIQTMEELSKEGDKVSNWMDFFTAGAAEFDSAHNFVANLLTAADEASEGGKAFRKAFTNIQIEEGVNLLDVLLGNIEINTEEGKKRFADAMQAISEVIGSTDWNIDNYTEIAAKINTALGGVFDAIGFGLNTEEPKEIKIKIDLDASEIKDEDLNHVRDLANVISSIGFTETGGQINFGTKEASIYWGYKIYKDPKSGEIFAQVGNGDSVPFNGEVSDAEAIAKWLTDTVFAEDLNNFTTVSESITTALKDEGFIFGNGESVEIDENGAVWYKEAQYGLKIQVGVTDNTEDTGFKFNDEYQSSEEVVRNAIEWIEGNQGTINELDAKIGGKRTGWSIIKDALGINKIRATYDLGGSYILHVEVAANANDDSKFTGVGLDTNGLSKVSGAIHTFIDKNTRALQVLSNYCNSPEVRNWQYSENGNLIGKIDLGGDVVAEMEVEGEGNFKGITIKAPDGSVLFYNDDPSALESLPHEFEAGFSTWYESKTGGLNQQLKLETYNFGANGAIKGTITITSTPEGKYYTPYNEVETVEEVKADWTKWKAENYDSLIEWLDENGFEEVELSPSEEGIQGTTYLKRDGITITYSFKIGEDGIPKTSFTNEENGTLADQLNTFLGDSETGWLANLKKELKEIDPDLDISVDDEGNGIISLQVGKVNVNGEIDVIYGEVTLDSDSNTDTVLKEIDALILQITIMQEKYEELKNLNSGVSSETLDSFIPSTIFAKWGLEIQFDDQGITITGSNQGINGTYKTLEQAAFAIAGINTANNLITSSNDPTQIAFFQKSLNDYLRAVELTDLFSEDVETILYNDEEIVVSLESIFNAYKEGNSELFNLLIEKASNIVNTKGALFEPNITEEEAAARKEQEEYNKAEADRKIREQQIAEDEADVRLMYYYATHSDGDTERRRMEDFVLRGQSIQQLEEEKELLDGFFSILDKASKIDILLSQVLNNSSLTDEQKNNARDKYDDVLKELGEYSEKLEKYYNESDLTYDEIVQILQGVTKYLEQEREERDKSYSKGYELSPADLVYYVDKLHDPTDVEELREGSPARVLRDSGIIENIIKGVNVNSAIQSTIEKLQLEDKEGNAEAITFLQGLLDSSKTEASKIQELIQKTHAPITYTQLESILKNSLKVTVENLPFGTGEAKGNVALSKGTLMGELGPELFVTGGHYYVAGQNGAEFVDLPQDAIVFNHLQTKRLLETGSTGRGTAVHGEKNAVSYAGGNVAMASASQAISRLQEIRKEWEQLLDFNPKDLATKAGGGGGGGGEEGINLHDLDRWYNLMRQIEKCEQQITYQQKLRVNMRKGDDYIKSLEYELALLEKQQANYQILAELQKSYYEARRRDLESSIYGSIFTYDQDGLMQYQDPAFQKVLAKIVETDSAGVAKYSNAQQKAIITSYLKAQGNTEDEINRVLAYKEDGTKVKDDNEWVENFWDKFDGWIEELDSMYDSYNNYLTKIQEAIEDQNKILEEYKDLQIDLEKQLLNAIEEREQAVIDKMQDNYDALSDSASAYLDGLNKALLKEQDMYNANKESQELVKMQRRLAILQRSGGSASEILSLQQQIDSQLQSSYFSEQQRQIEAIQDASDKQLEKLQQQIDIATETLEYQKAHGLLWAEVVSMMQNWTPQEMNAFVTEHNKEIAAMSAVERERTIDNNRIEFEKWYEHLHAFESFNDVWDTEMTDDRLLEQYGIDTSNKTIREAARATAKEAYQRYYADAEFAKNYTSAEEAMREALRGNSALHPFVPEEEIIEEIISTTGTGGSGTGGYSSSDQVRTKWDDLIREFESTKKIYNDNNYYPYHKDARDRLELILNQLQQLLNSYPSALRGKTLPTYDRGGMIEKTGLVLAHANEGVLTPEQVEQLRQLTIASGRESLAYQLAQLTDLLEIVAPSVIEKANDSLVIENATVNMNVQSIANDYDARRAGQEALEEMIRIARKTGAQSIRR